MCSFYSMYDDLYWCICNWVYLRMEIDSCACDYVAAYGPFWWAYGNGTLDIVHGLHPKIDIMYRSVTYFCMIEEVYIRCYLTKK